MRIIGLHKPYHMTSSRSAFGQHCARINILFIYLMNW